MKKNIFLVSIIVVCFLMLITACDTSNKKEVTPTLTPEEQEIQKKKDLVNLFDTADKYTFEEAKQIDTYETQKTTFTMDEIEHVQNYSETTKKNITDDATKFYKDLVSYGSGYSETEKMIYEGQTGYYSKDEVMLKKEISYSDFIQFCKEIEYPEDAPEQDFGYTDYNDFSYEELAEKYIGNFSNPDDKIKEYFNDMIKSSFEDESSEVQTCNIKSITEEVIMNKKGYIERCTGNAEIYIEMKIKGSDEVEKFTVKIVDTIEINKIDETIDINIPDLTSYLGVDNLMLAATIDDKLDDFINVNTYGKSNINMTRDINFGGIQNYKYSDEIKFAYEYNDANEIISYAEQGKQSYDGETATYSETYKDGKIYHSDDSEEYSVEMSSTELDDYISTCIRAHCSAKDYTKITTGNLGAGNVLTADIDNQYASSLSYGILSLLYTNPDEVWQTITDLNCNSLVVTIGFDENDNIISIAYKMDVVLATEDGDVTLKYSYTVERTQVS